MSGPYKPQARLDRDLLRHLHRRLACGSSHPTPLDGEKYGAWHARMTKDLQQSREEDAEEWRKQNGPWHAHEIKERDHLERFHMELDGLTRQTVRVTVVPPTLDTHQDLWNGNMELDGLPTTVFLPPINLQSYHTMLDGHR